MELDELDMLGIEKIKKRIVSYNEWGDYWDKIDKKEAERWRQQARYLENLLDRVE